MPDLVSTLIEKLDERAPSILRIGSIATDGSGQYLALDTAKLRIYLRLSTYTPTDGDAVLCLRLPTGVIVVGKLVTVP